MDDEGQSILFLAFAMGTIISIGAYALGHLKGRFARERIRHCGYKRRRIWMMSRPRNDQPQAIMLHNYRPGHNKFYVVRIDQISERTYRVVAAWGKATADRAQSQQDKGDFTNVPEAWHKACKLAEEKYRKGYTPLNSHDYDGRLTPQQIFDKIDTSRLVGHPDHVVETAMPSPPPSRRNTPPGGGTGRVGRSIRM